ncbi:FAD:protein FMN transferase [Nocardioides conyzicola]|uniref:FAD:protein FMN transferase n=1 Tax=Nocardioides conyzicola TaxID=1651781 RepID=A0ABP8XW40_9ACTN
MSPTTTWRDWSCRVRVTLAAGSDADLEASARIVRDLMDDVAIAVSRFRDDSDLTRVNARAGALIPVSALTVQLVEVALDAARRTDGAVDPTVGGHLLDAGYTDDIDAVRSRPRRGVAVPGMAASWAAVAVHRDLRLVGIPVGLRLDLGATAKAWTADEAARRVHTRLGVPALVEIGGDLSVAGPVPQPWRIDVAEVAGDPAYRVEVTHGGLATSSVLARAWTSDRGPEHHVIDPRTSRPARGSVRTATVWAPTAVEANTWSTAAIVWGDSAEARLLEAGVDARLVDADGRSTLLGAWPADERVTA